MKQSLEPIEICEILFTFLTLALANKKRTAINCIRSCNELYKNYLKIGNGLTCGPIKLTRMQDFFTYYIRQQTILADITIGCQSNGHRVSSISDLLAPAAKSSAGGTACSRLPWSVVLPRKPHRPLLLPPLARASLYSPTPPVILRRRQPHTAANQ